MNDRSPAGLTEDRRTALAASIRYLDRLRLSTAERGELLATLAPDGADTSRDPREDFAALHRALAGSSVAVDPTRASIRRRLAVAGADAPLVLDAHGRERLPTAPPLARSSMVPPPWTRGPFARVRAAREAAPGAGRGLTGGAASPDPQSHWHAVGTFRRVVLLGLVVAQTYIATNFMVAMLPTEPIAVFPSPAELAGTVIAAVKA